MRCCCLGGWVRWGLGVALIHLYADGTVLYVLWVNAVFEFYCERGYILASGWCGWGGGGGFGAGLLVGVFGFREGCREWGFCDDWWFHLCVVRCVWVSSCAGSVGCYAVCLAVRIRGVGWVRVVVCASWEEGLVGVVWWSEEICGVRDIVGGCVTSGMFLVYLWLVELVLSVFLAGVVGGLGAVLVSARVWCL